MKKCRFIKSLVCFIAVVLFVGIFSCKSVFAEDSEEVISRFPMQYLQVKVPDNTVVLEQNMSSTDSKWGSVGIKDVSTVKNTMKNSGVSAIFGDLNSKALVYYISSTQNTYDTFDISTWDDQKILDFASGLYGVENATEGTTVSFDLYKHSQTKFFTINLVETGDTKSESLIYATVINGMLIEFYMNTDSLGGINKEYIEKIVDNVYFTKIMTKEEYDAAVEKTWTVLIVVFASLIAMIILMIVINKILKKRRKKKNERLADLILEFRQKKQNGEINIRDIVCQTDTVYDSNLIDNFVVFNTWLKPVLVLLLWAAVYALILYYFINSGSTLAIVIIIAIGIGLLYFIYSKSEKYKENLCKQYDVKSKKQATFRFYNDYFTMTGVNSISEFIYEQITSVRTYKNYMYLYMSDTYAVMVDIDNLSDEDENKVVSLIKTKVKAL